MRLAINSKILLFIAALPIVWIGINIAVLGIDLPYGDQLDFVPLLSDFTDGSMQWSDLAAQHNEHRPVFPRVLWIGLAQVTNYSVNAELWLNLALVIITAVVFGFFVRRTWKRADVPDSVQWFFLPLFTLLIFNMVQWESWLMGFQTVMFLGVGCMVIGFLVMANYPSWTGLLGAALLGIVATFTMANALLFWPIGVALIVISHRRQRLWKCSAWIGVAAVVSILFFTDWSSPNANLATLSSIRPVAYLHWLLNFLGAPLLAYPPALLLGVLGVGLLVFFTLKIHPRSLLEDLSPYYAIMLFIIGTAMVIAIGRSYDGPRLALAPRYVTQTSWYWAALLVLLPLTTISRLWQNVILVLIVVLLLASTAGGSISAYKWRYLPIRPAYEAMRIGEPLTDEAVSALHKGVDPDLTRARLETVCRHGWSACPTE